MRLCGEALKSSEEYRSNRVLHCKTSPSKTDVAVANTELTSCRLGRDNSLP